MADGREKRRFGVRGGLRVLKRSIQPEVLSGQFLSRSVERLFCSLSFCQIHGIPADMAIGLHRTEHPRIACVRQAHGDLIDGFVRGQTTRH